MKIKLDDNFRSSAIAMKHKCHTVTPAAQQDTTASASQNRESDNARLAKAIYGEDSKEYKAMSAKPADAHAAGAHTPGPWRVIKHNHAHGDLWLSVNSEHGLDCRN
jgi:hypothetical protein